MRSLRSHSTTRSESLRASHLTFEQVLRNTLTSNVMIYTVGPFDEIDDQADPKRLIAAKSPTGEPLVVRTRTGYLAGPSG